MRCQFVSYWSIFLSKQICTEVFSNNKKELSLKNAVYYHLKVNCVLFSIFFFNVLWLFPSERKKIRLNSSKWNQYKRIQTCAPFSVWTTYLWYCWTDGGWHNVCEEILHVIPHHCSSGIQHEQISLYLISEDK